jgi:phosphoribosyl-ATP pyrophosphohydrolase/phosphoribosyl-AMP cyclohydrolase/histidinol dehydrogenase
MRRLEQLERVGRQATDERTLAVAAQILREVREGGLAAARAHGQRLGDLGPHDPIVLGPEQMQGAWQGLPEDARGVLARTAERIARFARAHRETLRDGAHGHGGWRYAPVSRAGCYAPGGRYPLPSSVLMTAVTAKVAGVAEVWVASPRPSPVTLAAAHLAGASSVLALGGAQAIGALAFGAGEVPRCDVVVGPGNRYVTAAKQLVAGQVGIDLLAGPSELVILADEGADPELVAADLLAQAEHDEDALPVLITPDGRLADRVDEVLERQLQDLPTAPTARIALERGFVLVVRSLAEGIAACDALAPEHLALHVREPERLSPAHYGALFVGDRSAEVLGDYGAGPNHVLPTGGTARSFGALSVTTFLRLQTWLRLDESLPTGELWEDVAALARMEGLEAHARAADRRKVI